MNQIYDLIIIGGGAAGMMAAISARRAHPELSIAIVDRTFALGRKILVCGAGRCNITNKNLGQNIQDYYYGAPVRFLNTVFNQFGYKEIVDFFTELGVELYVERKTDIGKLFPVTDQAHTITEMLLDEIERGEVGILLNTECSEIRRNEAGFILSTKQLEHDSESQIQCSYLLISAGGRTYPALGANGSGYDLVKSLGHKIIEPVPSALPIEAKNQLSQDLQGVKWEMAATSIIEGKDVKTRRDDVMFTQYGFSGPAILNISREVSIHFQREHKNDSWLKLNMLPDYDLNAAKVMLRARWERRPNQGLIKSLYGLLPNKAITPILKLAEILPERKVSSISEVELVRLTDILCNYKVQVNGVRGWNEAEFTAGGVDTNEINSQSMESKIIPGLYFAGEIVNVDGDVGGFNLSWSWASGFVAGKLTGRAA